MIKDKKILALIPARGGSKGIPGKNIKKFNGKPLIAWTINAAKKSKYIDDIVISTDDTRIANAARRYGMSIPFLRPKSLSGDNIASFDVVIHAIDVLGKEGRSFDVVLLLQPTSPLRSHLDIDGAIELLFKKKAKAMVSVTETSHSPLWTNLLPKNGCMKDFLGKRLKNINRRKLPTYFRLNGAIYLGYIDYIKANNGFYAEKTYAYIMPKRRSADIDDIVDFKLAEFLAKN